jgi:GT2 family glycosyltransferase
MNLSSSLRPPLTIAIVSWNTRALLAACLESLAPDAQSGLADVWVVDNASSDGSAQLVAQEFPWVRLIASEENLGFGAAVNRVAQATDSEWIAPANADLRFAPDALRRLLEAAPRHPEAGAFAPRLMLPDGSTQHSVYPFPSVPFTLAYAVGAITLSRRLARHWCIDGGFDPDEGRDVGWAVGAFLLVRRAAWDQAGGFDPAQWMYAEDLDLGWRLRRAGWRTRYVPEARIVHVESAATTRAWGGERHARWHASTYAWQARRRGFAVARVIAAINVGSYLARAALAWPAAVMGSEAARRTHDGALRVARAHTVGLRSRAFLEQVR